MTISSILNRVNYTGNGVTTGFAVSFPFRAAADLIVLSTVITTGVQTTKTITTHYTISGTPDALGYYSSGGSVTMLVAPANTERLTIYRTPARLQQLNLTESGSLPAELLEAQFDYLTMLVQRVTDLIGRSLHQPDGDSTSVGLLPSSVARASMFLAFNSAGDPVAVQAFTSDPGSTPVTAFMATLLDDTNQNDARTTLNALGNVSNIFVVHDTGDLTKQLTVDLSGLTTATLRTITMPDTDVTLADYDEGVWTPSVGGNATYTVQIGRYTKIGRQVTVMCNLTINAIGSGSTAQISGLPFAVAASHNASGAVFFTSLSTNVVTLTAWAAAGGSVVLLMSQAAAGASLTAAAVLGNGSLVHFTLTYFV